MNVEQECVCACGNLKYSTQKAQHKLDTLMDRWKRDKHHSSDRFLYFHHTVLLLGVRETAGIV